MTTIPRAQKTGRFSVVAEAHVTTIEVDNERPRYRRDLYQGRAGVLPAGGVVLRCRLRLRKRRGCCCFQSRRRIPNGLSNNHGQVGRHYFSHNQGGIGDRAVSVRL